MATSDSHCGSDLVPVAAAVERLLAACPAPPAVETMALAQARGRVTSRALRSRIDVPGHDNSGMDGYAVRADGPREVPVRQLAAAGSTPQTLAPTTAARIYTGAPIPAGADAVVMQEQCRVQGGNVILPEAIDLGQNVRRRGEDVQTGAAVIEAGTRLRPQELALAAAVGLQQVEVYRRLRVAVLTTGDELVQPGQALAPGQIHDSNGPLVAALVDMLGHECVSPQHLPDDFEATRAALAQAADTADVIITTGGVSVGGKDHVKPAVEALGALDLWRVAIKPGKPFAFGRVGATPFLGLPGNPVSVFVTFLVLARPFLARQQGRHVSADVSYVLPAAFDHERPAPIRREYLRARLTPRGHVEIHPRQGSGVLSSTTWADGLVPVEPGQVIHAGDNIPYLPFSDLLV